MWRSVVVRWSRLAPTGSTRKGVAVALIVLCLLAILVGVGLWLRLRQDVRHALDSGREDVRPLLFVASPRPPRPLTTWAGPEIEAIAFPGGELVTAGANGIHHARRGDLTPGLPTRRTVSLTLWAGDLVAALERGGVAVERGGLWHEVRSGWGVLNARVVVETPAHELLIGAREGLFRATLGGTTLERLDRHPVRAIVLAPDACFAGGEEGLWRVEATRAVAVATPDPWIESIVSARDSIFAVTAAGLALGPREGPLMPVHGAETARQAVWHEGRLWLTSDPPEARILVTDGAEPLREEALPSPGRRVLSASGLLYADTDDGLLRRDPDGWRSVSRRGGMLPPGASHVNALARFRGRLFAGCFDGGLISAEERAGDLEWRAEPGTATWGVNALLPAGGELWVASLRGAARYDGTRMRAVDGPGAAFSLAATSDGVVIGYGAGVLLPGGKLLSAFHGLPGNQALALAESDLLYIGTPSGLGALAGRRVAWRVTAGEGKLPHPWVTALGPEEEGMLVGTWGGGLVRRRVGPEPSSGVALLPPQTERWQRFAETEGLQVSPGAIAVADGRAWVGTDAHGLWRETKDHSRFERIAAPLPSPRVTALLAEPGVLWIGTDQGVTQLPVEMETQ